MLEFSRDHYELLEASLLPEGDEREHAAFLFARLVDQRHLRVEAVEALTPEAFNVQSWGSLALRDGALQEMILRAHREELALVEAHSHPFSLGPDVAFSPFDCEGLATTAPHVVWRLPGRPYGALVFGQSAFDGLLWAERQPDPTGVLELAVDGVRKPASGESFRRWGSDDR